MSNVLEGPILLAVFEEPSQCCYQLPLETCVLLLRYLHLPVGLVHARLQEQQHPMHVLEVPNNRGLQKLFFYSFLLYTMSRANTQCTARGQETREAGVGRKKQWGTETLGDL